MLPRAGAQQVAGGDDPQSHGAALRPPGASPVESRAIAGLLGPIPKDRKGKKPADDGKSSVEKFKGQSEPPVPGARLAPDGHHYVPDPRRPGKFLQVDHGDQPGSAVGS